MARPVVRLWWRRVGVVLVLGTATYLGPAPRAPANPAGVGGIQSLAWPTPFPGGCPPDSAEPGTQSAQYEPYLVADPSEPRRLVTAWIQDGGLGNVAATSADGGAHWARVLVPGTAHCTGGGPGGWVDPWLSFGADRTLYMVSMGADLPAEGFPITDPNTEIVANRSSDDGVTWSPAVVVQPEDGAFYDKPSITADPRRPGTAYAAWSRRMGPAGASGVAMLARTVDGGRSWSTPRVIYDPGPIPQWPHGNVITVLPDGSLLDVFVLVNDSPFFTGTVTVPDTEMAMRSEDGGLTWSTPVTIASVPSRLPGNSDSASQRLIGFPLPSVSLAPGGTVYAAWPQNPAPNAAGILLSNSSDGGRTWSPPSQGPPIPPAQVLMPTLAIDRSGVLGLLWYDSRNNGGGGGGGGSLITDVWFSHSHDGGHTWQETHVAGPFDALTAPDFFGQAREIGDYVGLVPTPGGFDTVFTQAKPAAPTGATNIFHTHIALGAPPSASAPAPLVGLPRRRSCASRRRLTIHLRVRHGERVTSIVVTVNGRAAARRRPRRADVRIDLRGLPLGSVTVRVRAHTSRGHTIRLRRRYRTCVRGRGRGHRERSPGGP